MMKAWINRILMITLTAVFFALIPGSAMPVQAGGDVDLNGIIKGLQSDGTIKVPDDYISYSKVYVNKDDLNSKYGGTFSDLYKQGKVEAYWRIGADGYGYRSVKAVLDKEGNFTYEVYRSDAGKYLSFLTDSVNNEDTHYNNNTSDIKIPGSSLGISLDIKTGILKVTGVTNLPGRTFDKLYVDGQQETDSFTRNYFSYNLDTKKYSIGSHSLKAILSDGNTVNYPYQIPTYIYAKPSIKAGQMRTWNNYFTFKAGLVPAKYDGIVISFRPKGGKAWTSGDPRKASGWACSYETCKFTGLKANTVYEVRAFYTKNLDGKNYSPLGLGTNTAYSNTIIIKTGPAAKPPVKSIKITKAKIKKSKLKGKWYWDNGKLKYLKARTVYKTSFKVTVTMKKKPGVKGIFIGDKKIKGNKKKYTAQFTVDGKMKGKKVNVSVRTYGNDSYGQLSPIYAKKVKVKK